MIGFIALTIQAPRRNSEVLAKRPDAELELIQSHMAQKPVLRGEVGCACVAREVSVERGGMDARSCLSRIIWPWCSTLAPTPTGSLGTTRPLNTLLLKHQQARLCHRAQKAAGPSNSNRFLFAPPPPWGGLDLDSRSSGCARLGGGVGPPLGVVPFRSLLAIDQN